MNFTIRVEWQRQDGTTAAAELITQGQDACESAGHVGLQLAEAKRIMAWMHGIVVNEQLEQYCEETRACRGCGQLRSLKDSRQRRFYTVLGKLKVKAPRFNECRVYKDRGCVSPVSELLRDRRDFDICRPSLPPNCPIARLRTCCGDCYPRPEV